MIMIRRYLTHFFHFFVVIYKKSGLDYTILHPGGLLDTPAGVEEIIINVDDVLLQETKRSISRADVANLCVAALVVGKNKRVSFDCITQPVIQSTTIRDDDSTNNNAPSNTATTTTTTPKTAEQVLAAFLQTGRTTNYEL